MAEVTKRSNLTIDEILRPQTRLDLIFDVDLINDYIDVRSAMVQDITQNQIVISQSDPPILKSMIGRSLEATFVRRDPVSSEMVRWGWRCQVLEIMPNYKVRPEDEAAVPAVALSIPPAGGLTETNARMDYRLSITSEKKITIQTHPSFGRVTLLDFSAGGVLIGIPRPPQAKVGMRLWFTLFFPVPSSPGQQTTINGEAEVVRITTNEGEQYARAGLKFLDLDLSATRALQKAINFYMLEEQRGRSRSAGGKPIPGHVQQAMPGSMGSHPAHAVPGVPRQPVAQPAPGGGAQPQHPGAQPQHPGAQPQHPGAQPQHPGAQPQQHPGVQQQPGVQRQPGVQQQPGGGQAPAGYPGQPNKPSGS